MAIPNADHAIVDRAKLVDYLLSSDHPTGRAKAPFFRSLGYYPSNWQLLERDLRAYHLRVSPVSEAVTPYGTKYIVRAPVTGPEGAVAMIITVWIIRSGETVPRLITAYPGE